MSKPLTLGQKAVTKLKAAKKKAIDAGDVLPWTAVAEIIDQVVGAAMLDEVEHEFGRPSKPSPPITAETIYKAYPRQVGRGAAIKAINKFLKNPAPRAFPVHTADQPTHAGIESYLLERTQAYAKATAGQDHKFIPHPATWFNQERFDDNPAEWSAANPRGAVERATTSRDYSKI